jgi:hypothetical protein
MATTPNQMQHVRELIKSGKRAQALTQLARLIERDHNNAELWWLLANATDDVHQARRALEEVLSLEPANDRARKMLERLETRQLLKQMGVAKTENTRRTPMVLPLVLIFVAVSGLLVVLALAVTNQQPPEEVAAFPTELDLPTETATLLPTETTAPTVVVLPEQTSDLQITDAADAAATVDPFAPTSDLEGIATSIPEVPATESVDPSSVQPTTEEITDGSAILPESTADQTQVAFAGTLPIEPTTNFTLTPTTDPAVALPESTQDPLPLDPNAQGTQVALAGTTLDQSLQPTVDPASGVIPTIDPALGVTTSDVTSTENRAILPEQEALNRGQVLDGVARRDLIQPYGVHSWTFSGYRSESITLELVNITGRGNPSLELRDESGAVVASDIDTVDTSNVDALIQLELPSDGIYTVIVRMAAVDEQLYSLTLTRQ